MCGIVGAVAKRDVTPILIKGLQRLEYRGYDSAGIAVHDAGQTQRVRSVGKVQSLVDAIAHNPVSGVTGIAHTRWATHGNVTEANAHPHMAGDRISLVHNGIIENFRVLREELIAAGHVFTSDTDSEVIVHLIDSYLTDGVDLLDAVRAALQRLEGAFALCVISAAEPERMIVTRLGSPLIIGKGIGENFVASDVLALRAVTDRFIYLEEGDLVSLTADTIDAWSVTNQAVVRSDVHVQMGDEDLDRGQYRHFMQKEIYQQPDVIRKALEGRIGDDRVLDGILGPGADELIAKVDAITIVACGTSYYAARVGSYWLEDLAGLPCHVEIASEFRYRSVATPPNNLFVCISQSGETADTLAALRKAKEGGYLATLALCNVPTSTIIREADLALMLNAGTEVGVASTKAFVAQQVCLMLLSLFVGARRGLLPARQTKVVADLRTLPNLVERVLELDSEIKRLAAELVDKQHVLFLGRGSLFPVALEGALKLKELSYIHAEGYAAGELKHGPLALVDEDMPIVAVAPNDELLEKLQSNLQEVRARGGKLYVFSERESQFQSEEGMVVVALPKCEPLMAPVTYVIALQLLAYHVAVHKGTDVDQPRNLAKSVTVE
ncbi:MAG: glutamine--fructose-6-phosphate transaminase (isomerizing) [OM182 bacterium]|jgi:glucosamine--fructose-6-phosphate aminotransferase (isomerizing)|nr:MAG: glutamine--fructose-6-phosphate transaminase (isomerizing) [OM182 bacterium]|tara:strand:- start:41 stop:1870 length:1830 start_codon:yes stop_codon:yes gene_type:complete